MAEFVAVQFETEAAELIDTAIAKLEEEMAAKGIVGYEPREAAPEIITLGVTAPMAANTAVIASVVPPAVFRAYGTQLFKLLYNEGAAATATTKWTLLEEGGEFAAHTIPAGTTLEAAGLAFYVEKTTAVVKGESSVTLQVVAAERGLEYNGLTGVLTLTNSLNYVSEVKLVGETSGGVAQETDEEYMNRLASALELQAPRPITAQNFATMTLDAPSSILPSGVVVGRATAIDGFNPEEHEFEATPKKAGKELTEVTSFTGITAESTTLPQIHPGTIITGTGIPANTTVVSLNEGTKKIVLSAEPTSEPGKEKLKAKGSYEQQRTVTVFVTDKEGNALSTPAKEALKAYLEDFRELNFAVFVQSANYNEVRVKATVKVLPGFVASSVVANAKAAIERYLSPATWGNPEGQTTGTNSWLNATQGYNRVRYNQIIGVLEAVQGVAYVPSGSAGLAIGKEEAPGAKVADLTLSGPAPLPETKAANIEVAAA
jgi:hypothetical protein